MALRRDDFGKIRKVKGMDTDVYEFFKNRGYGFSHEVITSYVLALQTKPFVILTGVSGTGKTKIAQVFADYLTQGPDPDAKERQIAFVPVRPDWMDNRGLLGFFNPITGEYQATRVLRLLLAAREEVEREKPYFVILDEMNLAKVEYYFSDFLSIMESRTEDDQEGRPIQLHDQGAVVKTADGLEIPSEIGISPNVFFTGTVNIDETTYMFSPKVLDRANVIELNAVGLSGYSRLSSSGDRFRLSKPDVRERFTRNGCKPFCTKSDYTTYSQQKEIKERDPIAELYRILEPYHLHFGYRVINEISRFVVLAVSEDQASDIETALDIQFLQKVLPKLHGTKGKLQRPLNDILWFCHGMQGKDSKSEPTNEVLKQAEDFHEGARFPRTAQKVARMLRELNEQGYTSFIQ